MGKQRKREGKGIMCIECVKEAIPDRQRTCLDDGHFLMNWKGCKSCGSFAPPKSQQRRTEQQSEEDSELGEEETLYNHVCSQCDHLICEHYYKFAITGVTQQEFFMECVLCGKGSDHVVFDQSPSDEERERNLSSKVEQALVENHVPEELEAREVVSLETLTAQLSNVMMSRPDDPDDVEASDTEEWD